MRHTAAAAAAACCAVTAASPLPAPTTEWQALFPGGATQCGKGAKWNFLAKRGTVNKLLIEFEGGGACFSETTCLLPQWTRSVDEGLAYLNGAHGYHNPSSPTAGWHMVFVPYCTGDGHTGNNTVDYGGLTGVVHHSGRVNAEAALAYAFQHFPSVEQTLTTGQSAGAVGSYVWAPYVMRQYPKARHSHLADSYVPLFGKTGINDGIKNWDMPGALAPFIPGLARQHVSAYRPGLAAYIVATTAAAFPSAQWSMYTSDHDVVQTGFYLDEGCGVDGCDWTAAMRGALAAAQANATNVASYIGPGVTHCRTTSDAMYSTESAGVRLSDWITAVVSHSLAPAGAAAVGVQRDVDCAPHCGWLGANSTANVTNTTAMR